MAYGTLAIDSITPSANALSVTGSVTSVNTFGFKNRFINGGLSVDQRNAGAAQTITAAAALAYTVDRWYAYCTGANVTGQQVAGTYQSSQYRYQFTGAASVTAIGFGQRIEAVNCYDLANTTATLSCYISNSLLTTVTWTAYYANTANTFGSLASPTVTQIATGTFTVTSTRAQYSAQIAIPSAATTGIQIVFTVGAQTSGTWIIDNIQLETGTQATSFDYRDIGRELILCQRYFQSENQPPLRGVAASGTALNRLGMSLPVTMRIGPTASLPDNILYWYDGVTAGTLTAISITYSYNTSAIEIDANAATGTSAAGRALVIYQNASQARLWLNAEL